MFDYLNLAIVWPLPEFFLVTNCINKEPDSNSDLDWDEDDDDSQGDDEEDVFAGFGF